jgi:hypothetical protein
MDTTAAYRITFEGASPADANVHAADLEAFLRDEVRGGDLQMTRERSSKDAQDFGATLVLVLGTAAVTAVGKGLQAWLARTGTTVTITDKDGTLVAQNVDSRNAASIVEAWAERRESRES